MTTTTQIDNDFVRCGCCGGRIPDDEKYDITWDGDGECPGHINSDDGTCGAIVGYKQILTVEVDDERYGEKMSFKTIAEAQQAIRDSGYLVCLAADGNDLVNGNGEIVGSVFYK